MPHLSVIIPVYNEVDSLPILHRRLRDNLDQLQVSYEIIFVDDGSRDGSTDVLCSFQAGRDDVVLAVQRRNFGKSRALAVGFTLSRGEVMLTLDADLQDEPTEIPKLLHKIDEGYDVVSGWKQKRNDPISKTLPSWIANRFTALLSGLPMHDMNSGFKAYRAASVQSLNLYGDLHRYIPVLANDAGFTVTEVSVEHNPRRFGRSKYGPGRLLSGGLDLLTVLFLTRYSRKPLHLFGMLGLLMLLVGFVINLILTIQWFQGMRPLSERPLLLLGILLMVLGVQFLSTGLLAELLVSYIERDSDPRRGLAALYRSSSK